MAVSSEFSLAVSRAKAARLLFRGDRRLKRVAPDFGQRGKYTDGPGQYVEFRIGSGLDWRETTLDAQAVRRSHTTAVTLSDTPEKSPT
jgi:hypothetical protein